MEISYPYTLPKALFQKEFPSFGTSFYPPKAHKVMFGENRYAALTEGQPLQGPISRFLGETGTKLNLYA